MIIFLSENVHGLSDDKRREVAERVALSFADALGFGDEDDSESENEPERIDNLPL